MIITQTVEVPDSRLITLKVPREIPTGKARLEINVIPFVKEEKSEPLAERVRRYVEEQSRIAEIEVPLEARGRGCLKGKIWMAEDFDEPLEDFKDYM